MVIAVYVDFKSYGASPMDLYFIKSLLQNLASDFLQHKYYLLQPNCIDEPGDDFGSFFFKSLKTSPGLFYNYRINRNIFKTLKALKADVLFSIDAVFKTGISQIALLSSLNKNPKLNAKRLETLKAVFVPSQQLKQELEEKYNPHRPIIVLHGGPSEKFKSVDDEIKSLIKEKYSEGKEYFVYRGRVKEQNNIIPLLKAFSLFKKRQKSTMKFVLMGKVFWQDNDFSKLINTYKYREDIVIADGEIPSEEANILAAAYALVQPYCVNNALFFFDAMQCAVPVLAANDSTLKNLSSDAALYFDSANETDIADKMMLVYKDERLRSRLIENGNTVINRYQWKKTIEGLAKYLH